MRLIDAMMRHSQQPRALHGVCYGVDAASAMDTVLGLAIGTGNE